MPVSALSSTVRQSPLQPLNRGASETAAAPQRLPGTTSARPAATPTASRLPATLAQAGRGAAIASPSREPGRQQRLGELQQGLAYTEQLGAALQDLKAALSQSLVRGPGAGESALQGRMATVQALWQQRSAASAGQLDGQMQPMAEGEAARQRFRIRGLDVAALSQGGSETLRLALPGQPRVITVALDGQGLQSQLQSLQRALAPTAVQLDTQVRELAFSVPESQFAALRDGLSLRGDGKRFPSGQMVRAVLEPQAQALTPTAWQLDEPQGQRHALTQLLSAQERLGSARARMAAELAKVDAASAAEPEQTAADAAALATFAAGFAERASASVLDYEQLSQLVPALAGLRRNQVQQLLTL